MEALLENRVSVVQSTTVADREVAQHEDDRVDAFMVALDPDLWRRISGVEGGGAPVRRFFQWSTP